MPKVQSQISNGSSNVAPLSLPALTESALTPLQQRHVAALRLAYPTLPLPVAVAMVERASLEPIGSLLGRLEAILDEVNALPEVVTRSGSQTRVLVVMLSQVVSRLLTLEARFQADAEKS